MCRFKNFLKKITEIKLIVPMRDIHRNILKPIASLLTQFSYLYLQITAS